jgi:hypothetical protein
MQRRYVSINASNNKRSTIINLTQYTDIAYNPVISIDTNDAIYVTWYFYGLQGRQIFLKIKRAGGGWSGEITQISATTEDRYPSMLWSMHPQISGVRTNIPKTGFAMMWNALVDTLITTEKYNARDLTWYTAGLIKWNYTQANSYGTTYYWKVTANDGNTNVSSSVHSFTTKAGYIIPTISLISPLNQSKNINRQPLCKIWANKSGGGMLTINFYDNSSGSGWIRRQTDTQSAGQMDQWNYSLATVYSKRYYWRVSVSDGTTNISRVYYFTIKNSSVGNISSVISKFIWDSIYGRCPEAVRLGNSEYYLITAVSGASGQNYSMAYTIKVWNGNGTIKQAVVDSYNYDTQGYYTSVVPVYGDVYAFLTYHGNEPMIRTFKAYANNGTIQHSITDSLQLGASAPGGSGNHLNIIRVSGNMFAAAYSNNANTGVWIETAYINNSGIMSETAANDTQLVEYSPLMRPKMAAVDADTIALVAETKDTNPSKSILVTYDISPTNGSISNINDSEWTFTSTAGGFSVHPVIKKIGDTKYMIAYYNGWPQIRTVDISNAGTITKSWIGSLNDTAYGFGSAGALPYIQQVSGNVYAVAFCNRGRMITVTVQRDGTMGGVLSSFVWNSTLNSNNWYPSTIWCAGNYYLIVTQGLNAKGTATTVSITTDNAPTSYVITPKNQTTNVNKQPTCRIWTNDTQLQALVVNFYSSTDGSSFTHRQKNTTGATAGAIVAWNYSQANAYSTKYYWKATLNDTTTNSSYIYQFTTRGPPPQTTYLISPKNQSTGLSRKPACKIWANDTASTSLTINFYSSPDGITYVHQQKNTTGAVLSTMVVWNYSLAIGWITRYYWKVTNFDGTNNISTAYYFTTKGSPNPPYQYIAYPKNQSLSLNLKPKCRFWANDTDGGLLTVNIYENSTTSWVRRQTNTSVAANTSMQWNYSWAQNNNQRYGWRVTVYDGSANVSKTYWFTTKISYTHIPTTYVVMPKNHSTGIIRQPRCRVLANDSNFDVLQVDFYSSTDGITYACRQRNTTSGTLQVNQVVWNYSLASGYNTRYYWKVTNYDGTTNSSTWYYFNTMTAPIQINTTIYIGRLYKDIDIGNATKMSIWCNTTQPITIWEIGWVNFTQGVVECLNRTRGTFFVENQTDGSQYYWHLGTIYNSTGSIGSGVAGDCSYETVESGGAKNNINRSLMNFSYVGKKSGVVSTTLGILPGETSFVGISGYVNLLYTLRSTTVTVHPAKPTSFAATGYNTTQINLTWTRSVSAARTIIRGKLNFYPTSINDATSRLVANTTVQRWNDSGRNPGEHWYYRAWSWNATTNLYSMNNLTTNATTSTGAVTTLSGFLVTGYTIAQGHKRHAVDNLNFSATITNANAVFINIKTPKGAVINQSLLINHSAVTNSYWCNRNFSNGLPKVIIGYGWPNPLWGNGSYNVSIFAKGTNGVARSSVIWFNIYPTCDVTMNNITNAGDLSWVIGHHWLESGGNRFTIEDINGNGIVNAGDLSFMINAKNWLWSGGH